MLRSRCLVIAKIVQFNKLGFQRCFSKIDKITEKR